MDPTWVTQRCFLSEISPSLHQPIHHLDLSQNVSSIDDPARAKTHEKNYPIHLELDKGDINLIELDTTRAISLTNLK